MSNSPPKKPRVFAPNLHLFAFHLYKDLALIPTTSEKPNKDPALMVATTPENQKLWQTGQALLDRFKIKDHLKITEQRGYRVDLLDRQDPDKVSLPLASKIDLEAESVALTGLAYPLRLHDTNILWFNLRRPEQENDQATKPISLDFFQALNPDHCFLPPQIGSSLGQTLLLTIWKTPEKTWQFWRSPPNTQDLQQLSDQTLTTFLNGAPTPPKNHQGELFNSPIFEYGISTDIEDYNHILVWIFCEPATDQKFQDCYSSLIDLLVYRNKIIKSYQNSRQLYQVIAQEYQNIEAEIDQIFPKLSNKISLETKVLEDFKQYLQTSPAIYLEFTRSLRDLEHCRLTIQINTKNYQQVITHIQQQYPDEKLRFLQHFVQEDCQLFLEQIQADLGYYQSMTALLDNALNTIRGRVEIEQTEIDRSLERTIQILGVGLGAGGITASAISGHIDKPLEVKGNQIHPGVLSLVVSVAIALIAGLITASLLSLKGKNQQNR